MKNYQLILLLLFLFGAFQLKAQEDEIDPMPIKLKGQVLNLDDETPVAYASITNYRTHSRVTTNEQGYFTVDALNIDSLEVSSLGFTKTVFHIPANYNEMNVLIVYAKPVRFALPQVNVKGEKQKVNMDGVPMGKKLDIDPQLRGDVYQKKPSVLSAIFNPASFMQYYTSKKEKEKRETRQAIVTEKKWETLSQYYNKDLVMQLTGLSEFQVDSFMIYFNSKGILAQLQTEYDV
ncbi:MAG: carboxypeptidase-like regulatory domain-containing protein, partial [Candidatus Saccharibacteria bacterium]